MNYQVMNLIMEKGESLGFTISGQLDSYLKVCKVVPFGPASKAGIREGDRILQINNAIIKERNDIFENIRKSKDEIFITVIRETKSVSNNILHCRKSNSLISRRASLNVGPGSLSDYRTLHEELILNTGSKIGMEISRSPGGTLKSSNDISHTPIKVQRKYSQSSDKLVKLDISSSSSDFNFVKPLMAQNINSTAVECQSNHGYLSRNVSLTKKQKTENAQFSQSLTNISLLSKSVQHLTNGTPVNESIVPKLRVKKQSTVSLFEDNQSTNLLDYNIDWKAIYQKIAFETSSEIESELMNYFRHKQVNLDDFPPNCLYRFMTFDFILKFIFENILSTKDNADIQYELENISCPLHDIDYGMTSYNIPNLLKCCIRKFNETLSQYQKRHLNLNGAKESLKERLDEYLNDQSTSSKMHEQVDRIYVIFNQFSNFLTSAAFAIAMWKFSQTFSYLYSNMTSNAPAVFTSNDNILESVRSSHKNLQQNIINLFRRFKSDRSDEVMKYFDEFFSESLTLSICIPILNEKIKRDTELCKHLQRINSKSEAVRVEQFV